MAMSFGFGGAARCFADARVNRFLVLACEKGLPSIVRGEGERGGTTWD